MIKRMMLLAGMALAMVAVAAPVARANVSLSDSDGTLEPGAEVTATSKNLVTTLNGNPNVTLHCKLVTLHFELLDGGPTHLELQQLGAATIEGCTYQDPEKSFPQTNADGTIGVGANGILTVDTWGTSNTNATFISRLFADPGHTIIISECHFAGQLHLVAKGNGSDELNVTPSTLVGTPLASCGHGTIEGDFTLETENGDPVQINYVQTD